MKKLQKITLSYEYVYLHSLLRLPEYITAIPAFSIATTTSSPRKI